MSYNKYYLYKKQVSSDNGQTWEDVTPLETVPSGDVIATYDTLAECESYYSSQYLTFVAEENCTFTFTPQNSNVIYYSLNNGSTWTQGTAVTVSTSNKVMWKGTMSPNNGIGTFSGSTGSFHVEGNIMSLLYGDNFEGQTSLEGNHGAVFNILFYKCTSLTSAENLVLPATTLANACYQGMFWDCTRLTTAPQLPATTLAESCYGQMFQGCYRLTTAPELPATTLTNWCYSNMFAGCYLLTTAPQLPATTLADNCYNGMFWGTLLTNIPSGLLPATTLAEYCYRNMFRECTALKTAPELPATTLAQGCYDSMFYGCHRLTTAPQLLATTLAERCYYMMFYNCLRLNYIKCLATNISATDCTSNWVGGVLSSGTFVKASSMNDWTTGVNGIPDGWTVQNA